MNIIHQTIEYVCEKGKFREPQQKRQSFLVIDLCGSMIKAKMAYIYICKNISL